MNDLLILGYLYCIVIFIFTIIYVVKKLKK